MFKQIKLFGSWKNIYGNIRQDCPFEEKNTLETTTEKLKLMNQE